jgi:hypothetical protein
VRAQGLAVAGRLFLGDADRIAHAVRCTLEMKCTHSGARQRWTWVAHAAAQSVYLRC